MAERTCDCGADISDRHGNARFCRSCYTLRPKNVHNAARDARRPWHDTCKGCGAKFPQPKQGSRYCTKQCAGKHNRAKQLGTFAKVCVVCGTDFTAQDNKPSACSVACKQWERKYPGVPRILARECLHCCQPFIANTAAQRYCTIRCRASAGKIRRRGHMASAFVEDVRKGIIAERDKWKCQLCGEKVPKNLRFPHPMSWSLDHIIPISQGGEHSRANTQLAHLACNVAKGAKIRTPQQLALLG